MKATSGTATLTATSKLDTINVVAGTTGAETIRIDMGANDTQIDAGKTLVVNASALTAAGATLQFVGVSNETDGAVSVTGGANADTITGTAGNDTINSGAGNDTIDTGNGANVVDAGAGNDTITAGTGADNLSGGDGDDVFVLAGNLASTDTINGNAGTNRLSVSAAIASATVLGGVSNIDTLVVTGASAVTLAANVAMTKFDFTEAADQVLTLNTGYTNATTVTLTGDSTNADSIINSANVALTVIANDADIDATTTITGGTGTDTIQLKATSGTATLTATSGLDTITVLAGTVGTETITIAMGANNTQIGAGKTLAVNASALTNAAATLTFTGVANETDGAVSVTGGAGADTITGTDGNDTILGGSGADSIISLKGIDVLTGGAGADTFTVAPSADGNIYATITDFTAGDKITFVDQGTEVFNATKLLLANTAVFQDYLNLATTGTGAGTNAVISWFQYNGDTYVVQDLSNTGAFVNGTDLVVKIVGSVDLSGMTGAGTNIFTAV